MHEIGIICGMQSELATLGRWRFHPRVSAALSAARPDRASEIAARYAEGRIRLLVSWGIAGGLSPDLNSGDVLVPQAVIGPLGETFPLAHGFLETEGNDHRGGIVAGADAVIPDQAAKAKLRDWSGADIVDMETHRVADVAQSAQIPCLAVRAVSDPAMRALPASAAGALDDDGRPRIAHVLKGLVRRPADLPALIAAKRDSDRALAALSSVADQIFSDLLKDVRERRRT